MPWLRGILCTPKQELEFHQLVPGKAEQALDEHEL
jgi:hypothetical protein